VWIGKPGSAKPSQDSLSLSSLLPKKEPDAIFLASDQSVKDVTGQYFYKCKIAKSSKRSKDPFLARRLFTLSMKMTGLSIENK
jgi:hypothetical protein